MDCPHCRASAATAARYCSFCGSRLDEAVISPDHLGCDAIFDDRRFAESVAALSPDLMCVFDVIEQRYRYVNEAATRFFGLTREELLGSNGLQLVVDRIHPEDRATTLSRLEEIVQTFNERTDAFDDRRIEELEYRLLDGKGRWRWLRSWRTLFARTPDGRVSHILGIVHDDTNAKNAQQALKAREAEAKVLALIAARTHNAVILTDADGRIEWINDGFNRMTGYTLDEARGLRPGTLLQGPDSNLQVIDEMRQAVRAGREFTAELINYHKSGRSFWVAIEVQPLRDETGRLTHFMAIESDITTRKQVEDALRIKQGRLRLALEVAGMLSWDWAIDTNEITFSQDYGEYFDLPPTGTVVASNNELMLEPVHIDDREDLMEAFRKTLKTGRDLRIEFRGPLRKGEQTWYAARGRILEIGDNRPLRMIGITQDITLRRQSEESLRLSNEELERRVQERTDALRQSEDRYRSIVHDQTELICRTTSDCRLLFVNDAFARFFGRTSETLTGQSFLQFISETDRPQVRKFWASFTPDQPIRTHELSVIDHQGRTRWHQWTDRAFFDDQGRCIEFQKVARDITERKLTEMALNQSEQRFRSLVERSPVGVWQVGSDGNTIQYLNPTLRQILEIPADEEVCGKQIKDFIAPECRDISSRQMELRRRGLSSGYEINYLSRTGRRVPAQVFGAPIVDQNALPSAMVGMSIDITERKLAEQSLRESEERYRALFDTCTDAVFLLDVVGHILAANPAAARMHGYTSSELLARNISDLVDPAVAQFVPERMHRLKKGEDLRFEVDHRRKDGTTFPVEVIATSMHLGDDTFILSFDRDISERKHKEEQTSSLRDQLAHVSRVAVIGEMATGLAHELNQPLTALHLYANAAHDIAVQFNSSQLNDCLRRIGDQSLRAGSIIRGIRSLAKRDQSRRTQVDVNQLIREVVVLLQHDLRQQEITLNLGLDEKLPRILADGIQIQQVLVNLIRNAVDAMSSVADRTRTLSIDTEVVSDGIGVSVGDTGCCIDPATAEELFQPFQTTKSMGLGLGLAISRTLIEAHGGRIEVRANRTAGTSFFFVLPVPQEFRRA